MKGAVSYLEGTKADDAVVEKRRVKTQSRRFHEALPPPVCGVSFLDDHDAPRRESLTSVN